MKKLITLLLVAGLITTACTTAEDTEQPVATSETQPSESAQQTQPASTSPCEAISTGEQPTVTALTPVASPPKPASHNSLDELRAYISENVTRPVEDVVAGLIVPKNHLPGFEKITFSYTYGADENGADQYVFVIEHIAEKYVYNDEFCAATNESLSRARYQTGFSEETVKHREETIKHFLGQGYIPLNLENQSIIHTEVYDFSDNELLLAHHFIYFEGDIMIQAFLPALPGLSALDMVKYLEMVPVM